MPLTGTSLVVSIVVQLGVVVEGHHDWNLDGDRAQRKLPLRRQLRDFKNLSYTPATPKWSLYVLPSTYWLSGCFYVMRLKQLEQEEVRVNVSPNG